jgi:hypothetical protein
LVLQETHDRVLNDPAILRNTAALRAAAWHILGEGGFAAVRYEDHEARYDCEYGQEESIITQCPRKEWTHMCPSPNVGTTVDAFLD